MKVIYIFYVKMFILVLGMFGLYGCASPQPLNTIKAQTTVANSWQTNCHIVWELNWPTAPLGGPITVEVWQAGPRYRYEILEAAAPALVGQTLVFDGQTARQYNRLESSPPETLVKPALSPVSEAFSTIDRLITLVPQTATHEAVALPHGSAQKISLTFTGGEQLSLWRDESTGLPAQVEFTVNGQSATLQARSMALLSTPPVGLFVP